MARRGNRRTNSVGPIVGIVALLGFVAVAATMVVSGQRTGEGAGAASDVSGAIGGVMTAPIRWVEGGMSSVGSFFGGSTLNAKLKAENKSLLQWRDQARAMAERLDTYEKLHSIAGEPLPTGLTGRLISESAGPFSRAGIVNLGEKEGIKVNWIVMNQNGLVGRVIAVGANTSRVLMLGDGDSRVPVMGELTRARAIASGDKSAAPRLAHLNTPALMLNGERVVTSGDDGIFPRGITVGQAGIAPNKQWHVRLASNAGPIDFVRLLPPSNFPPPIDTVTPPQLLPPPLSPPVSGAPPSAVGLGAVLPLAPGAAPVPVAATPEAIRAAQLQRAQQAQQASQVQAQNKKLTAERDAAREVARRAELARVAAERRAVVKPRESAGAAEKNETVVKAKPLDPASVPVATSAQVPKVATPKNPTEPDPPVGNPK